MKKLYFLFCLGFIFMNHVFSQNYCGTPRYDQDVFSNYTTSSNITYGSAKNFYNSTTTLQMDIYQPAGDNATARPLIIWVHGGSFLGGDKLTDSDVVEFAKRFAKKGYVTASINYRIYYLPFNSEIQAKKAVMRAVQDLKAAVRFFRKDAYTNNVYKIDTNHIFVGGSSAGALTSMHLAYLDTDAEYAAEIDTTGLGTLEGNSGNPGYSSKVHGVINLCGALGGADYLIPGDEPLVSMHGTIDGTVPYATAPIPQVPSLVVDGSYSINKYADSLGIINSMYTWFGADHTPWHSGGTLASQAAYLDTTMRFVSNFLYKLLTCYPTDPKPIANTFVSGDSNGNHAIDGSEIAGDSNKNGNIDNGEIAGDLNGNGSINPPTEIAGDVNGNGVIDLNETGGDLNGNGSIDGTEVNGDINADGVYNSSDWLTSIENKEPLDINFSFSPNPASDKLYLGFNLNREENISAEIFDIIGKQVSIINDKKYNAGKHKIEIDNENLKPGIYFIKINHQGISTTKKVIISK